MEPTDLAKQVLVGQQCGEIQIVGFPTGKHVAAIPKEMNMPGRLTIECEATKAKNYLLTWLKQSTAVVVVEKPNNKPEVLWNLGEAWNHRPLKERLIETLLRKRIVGDPFTAQLGDMDALFASISWKNLVLMNIYVSMERKGCVTHPDYRPDSPYPNLLLLY